MISEQKIKNYLHDWAMWVGNNKSEIKKDVGFGKGPSKILVDMAKHDDPDTVYHKSKASNLNQDAMREIDRIIKSKMITDIQRDLITARYQWRWGVAKIKKRLDWSNRKYYRLHDETIQIIGDNFNLAVMHTGTFKSFI